MKIALIEDHLMFAETLRTSLLQYPEISAVSVFHSVKAFLKQKHRETLPDIILLDILLADINGLDAISVIRRRYHGAKIIILSTIGDMQTVRSAIRKGANGYVHKGAPMSELIEALETVYQGQPYINEDIKKEILNNSIYDDEGSLDLSPKQEEVLKYLCEGKTVKEIAYEMDISVNTVQSYCKIILKKFKVNRTLDLVLLIMNNDLYRALYVRK
jgi:DNA-binding NarL/FixJ family response regulator